MAAVEIWYGPDGPGETKNLFDAESFLGFLRRSGPHWQSKDQPVEVDEWVFRGHARADWKLIPSAARQLEFNKPLANIIEAHDRELATFSGFGAISNSHRRIVAHLTAYAAAIRAFVKFGREIGVFDHDLTVDFLEHLKTSNATDIQNLIGGVWYWILDPSINAGINPFRNVTNYPHSRSDLAALAQHHGIPTFQLDWTENPWNAAFFASDDDKVEYADCGICVWALNRLAIDMRQEWLPMAGPKVSCFQPDRSHNPFISAQRGLMVFLSFDENCWVETGEWLPLENAISMFTLDHDFQYIGQFHSSNELYSLKPRLSEFYASQSPFLRKVVLPSKEVPRLRRLLRLEGITRWHLMPTLDNLASTSLKIASDAVTASEP